MEKDIKKPQIRFQGFTEGWEQRKLGEIMDEVTDYVAAGSFADLAKNVQYINEPCYAQLIRTIDLKHNFSNENFIYVDKNAFDFLWRVNLNKECIILPNIGANIGEVYYIEPETLPYQNNVLGPNAIYLKPKSSNKFIYSLFQTKEFQYKLAIIIASSGQPKFNKTELKEIGVSIPSPEEQEKIGAFFKQIDNLISLHQRKYDSLVKVKKSMLEKMFPRRGAKKPEIRFARFTDDWEQRKLKDIVIIERGGSPRPIESFITNSENGLNWVKIGDAHEQGNYITKTKEKIKPEGLTKTREVHPGDLILSNSMSFGKPYIMGIDGCIHDGWLLIRDVNKIFDLKYLCCMLGTEQMLSQYKSMAAGSTVNNLNKELVGNTIIKYPNKNEQKQIGAFFDKIDNLITLHQRKLNLLKNMKKAMLEKMFV